jgi:methyltransferase-like protein/cyclopropane fatty-acyl-phospholipid synthase-like methyltransferase
MSETSVTSYDEIPYSTTPFYYSHPDRLASTALLFGLAPPPVDRCRVLELGCGRGGNLIPMAQGLPRSRFVGIDLSQGQTASAQAVVNQLGLTNIELVARSILDVGDDLGTFDYIICHGVYSWVPAVVQEKIFAICKHNLAANGVAYVSYNTYPGWHMRGIVREMLGYHARRFAEPRSRLHQARAFLDFLAEAVEGATNVYGRLLLEEITELRKQADSYLFHEHLEETNHPLYFHEFAERAAAKGLQYLAEAQFSPLPTTLSSKVRGVVDQLAPDPIAQEQYRDFLRGRAFRRTLLVHDHVALKRPPAAEPLTSLHVTTRLQPVVSSPPAADGGEQFATAKGVTMSTNNPFLKAALHILFESWPRSLAFETLWTRVLARLDETAPPLPGGERGRGEGQNAPVFGPTQLAQSLLQCFLADVVELHVQPPDFVLEISERPVASPLARLQAAAGEPITNLRHYTAELDDFDRLVVQYLDGSRDCAALLEILAEAVRAGELTIEQDRQALQADMAGAVLRQSLEDCLRRLVSSALLVR